MNYIVWMLDGKWKCADWGFQPPEGAVVCHVQEKFVEDAKTEAIARLQYCKRLKLSPGAPPVATRAQGRHTAKVACGRCWGVSIVANADGGSGVLEELSSADGFAEGLDGRWYCGTCLDEYRAGKPPVRHTDGCECDTPWADECEDAPKIAFPDGWQWDGTGDLGVWALNCMSEGRHFVVDAAINGEHDVWTVAEVTRNGYYVAATSRSGHSKQFMGDELVYSVEQYRTDL